MKTRNCLSLKHLISVVLFTGWLAAGGILTAAEDDAPAPRDEIKRVEAQVDRDRFAEGWKLTVRPKLMNGQGDVFDVWVEGGWLHARRSTPQGDLDWQLTLAEVVPGELPSITTIEPLGSFELSYQRGRYFVRDTFQYLRAVRQRPDAEHCLSSGAAFSERAKSRGYGRSIWGGFWLTGWEFDDWFFVTSGPAEKRFDSIVRLNPVKKQSPGNGVFASPVICRYFHGEETSVIDDGELLVATRTLLADYQGELAVERIRETIRGGTPAAIDASKWLNTSDELSWDKLKGKVVLLDFWGTWCSPCVKKLPDVQKFADKFADRGVVVIGIHSAQDGDACQEFVEKKGITFPIAIDSGKTAERFGIGEWPSVFLIDKTGKVAVSYQNAVPADEVVEKLLKD